MRTTALTICTLLTFLIFNSCSKHKQQENLTTNAVTWDVIEPIDYGKYHNLAMEYIVQNIQEKSSLNQVLDTLPDILTDFIYAYVSDESSELYDPSIIRDSLLIQTQNYINYLIESETLFESDPFSQSLESGELQHYINQIKSASIYHSNGDTTQIKELIGAYTDTIATVFTGLDRDFLLMEASIAKGSTCYWTKQSALGSSGWWNSQERACTGNCIANADIEGGIGGAIAGGIAGAVGGSVLPGPGTVTGFIGGAVMGGFWGATTASATRAIFSIFGTK